MAGKSDYGKGDKTRPFDRKKWDAFWDRHEFMKLYKVKQNKRVYPIPGFVGYYISKSGGVWSDKSEKWLVPIHCNRWGHLRISLYREGQEYKTLIHRLVLETFIGPCPSGMEACHNNGNSGDNRLGNLRWDTRSNNIVDAIKHGTWFNTDKKNHRGAILNRLQVRVIRRLLEFERLKQREIANIFAVSQRAISDIKNNKKWRII